MSFQRNHVILPLKAGQYCIMINSWISSNKPGTRNAQAFIGSATKPASTFFRSFQKPTRSRRVQHEHRFYLWNDYRVFHRRLHGLFDVCEVGRMNISDYPDDIRVAVNDATDHIEGDGMPGGGYSWSSIERAIAYAISQERIRCIELAYKHYVHTPNREGAKALSFAIAEGKRA